MRKKVIQCIQCKKCYPQYEGNFNTSKVSKSGYRGQCKTCCTNNRADWKERHQDQEKERLDAYNKKVRNKRRREGRYKESQEAYKERANMLRRENNKHKRILKKTGEMHRQLYGKITYATWMDSPERKSLIEIGHYYSKEKEILTNQIMYR